MNASMRIKREAAPIDDDALLGNSGDDTAESYTWLDTQADNRSAPVEDDQIDIDDVPTLYDVVEQHFVLSQNDGQDEQHEQHDYQPKEMFPESSDVLELHLPVFAPDEDVAPEAQEQIEIDPDRHADLQATLADHQGAASQAPLHSMEDFFDLARYEPVQLQRVLMALAGVFQLIAGAALWRAVGDRVIATELVPPLVYAFIGVAAYLLGMKYVRIHFAQTRVGDKDWLLSEHVVIAGDNGVLLKVQFGTAYVIWEQLLGVAQDNDYYYLLIASSQGFKIPKQGVQGTDLKTKLDDLASLTRAKSLQGM